MQAIVSSLALKEPKNYLKKLSAPRLDNLKLNQLNKAPISPIARHEREPMRATTPNATARGNWVDSIFWSRIAGYFSSMPCSKGKP